MSGAGDGGEPDDGHRERRVIAVCGIDGAGKSTLVDGLVARLRQDGLAVTAARKRSRANVEAVEQLDHAEPGGDGAGPGRDVASGPFADAVRWAHAFDFLRFYLDEVQGAATELVVADRWTVCSITYAAAGTGFAEPVASLLAPVPRPTGVVYLDVPEDEAVARIRRRGTQRANEDAAILRACRAAYDEWLPRLGCPVQRLAPAPPDVILAQAVAFTRQLLARA